MHTLSIEGATTQRSDTHPLSTIMLRRLCGVGNSSLRVRATPRRETLHCTSQHARQPCNAVCVQYIRQGLESKEIGPTLAFMVLQLQ